MLQSGRKQDKQAVTRDSTHSATGKGMSLPAVPVSTQFKAEAAGQLKEGETIPAQFEPFQPKDPLQPVGPQSPEEKRPLQTKPFQLQNNNTGMPDTLKSGMEALSGFDLGDVRVHYNSSKPAQLQALAYAQGSDIHVGPGQERHLPHEAWHVVQQKQGRVQPTIQMNEGIAINDDKGLEQEADTMGEKAMQLKLETYSAIQAGAPGQVVQRITVKVGTSEKDLADFKSAEPTLMKYLGGDPPVSIDSAALGGEAGQTTNIWGHMSDTLVGDKTHAELAKVMTDKGYRTSSQIRMIGCNVQGPASAEGPTKLWKALHTELSKILVESRPVVPTIYATRGPLHTGGPSLAPGQNFYVVEKDNPDFNYDETYMKEMAKHAAHRKSKMRQYENEDRETANKMVLEKYAAEITGGTSQSDVLAKYKSEIDSYINGKKIKNAEYYELTYGRRLDQSIQDRQTRKSENYDKEQLATSKYPSIFKPGETSPTGWVWNDAGWVSYSGPTE